MNHSFEIFGKWTSQPFTDTCKPCTCTCLHYAWVRWAQCPVVVDGFMAQVCQR